MPITYLKGDLFQHPNLNEYTIVHACNAQGVWGSGFAKQCKEKYFVSFETYKETIDDLKRENEKVPGCAIILNTTTPDPMVCLITSENYGDKVDSPEVILANTKLALERLSKYGYFTGKFISPKFNSGLFGVPWEQTEAILKEFVDKHNVEWIVYEF